MAEATHRTTVTIPKELFTRFDALAESLGIFQPEAFRQAVTQFLNLHEADKKEVQAAQQLARTLLERARTLQNPYQQLVCDWRLARTGGQIDQIMEARLDLEAWPAHTYLTKVLSGLLEKFNANDQFFTITTLAFWKDALVDTFYLQEQVEAVKRGMTLKRIFLLRDDEREKAPEALRPHYEFLKKFPLNGPVDVRYVNSQPPESHKLDHFALIRRRKDRNVSVETDGDQGCMLVEPAYDFGGTITRLRFLFSNDDQPRSHDSEIRFHISRFQRFAEISRPISELY
jgi:predicted transcriptional regulator